MWDFPERIAQAEEIIKAVDTRPKQVLVGATIMSALLTEDMQLGVDLNFISGQSITGVSGLNSLTGGTPIQTTGFTGTTDGKGLKIGITTGDVSAFITALESTTDTTILANPKILAVNKQEGSMLIG
jgi:type II secretory pathway component GspD/PulD (secretin)